MIELEELEPKISEEPILDAHFPVATGTTQSSRTKPENTSTNTASG